MRVCVCVCARVCVCVCVRACVHRQGLLIHNELVLQLHKFQSKLLPISKSGLYLLLKLPREIKSGIGLSLLIYTSVIIMNIIDGKSIKHIMPTLWAQIVSITDKAYICNTQNYAQE